MESVATFELRTLDPGYKFENRFNPNQPGYELIGRVPEGAEVS